MGYPAETTKFSRDKRQVPLLGRKNPEEKYRQSGGEQLCGKGFGGLGGHKIGAQAVCKGRGMRGDNHLWSPFVRPHCIQSGDPQCRKAMDKLE